jgi:hypothetical protein
MNICSEEDLVHMGTSALIISKILKILKSHKSIFLKNYGIKYIDRYTQEECM